MIRHQQNTNLRLFYEPCYRGFPVQLEKAPLIEDYLEQTLNVIHAALSHHPRVFAFRVDLHFPSNQFIADAATNKPLERFIASFKAKIRHNRSMRFEAHGCVHETTVSYIWCREVGKHGVPHYHLAILLNRDAFCTLGQFEIGRKNIFNRLVESWASALRLPVEHTDGLVHIPKNAAYALTSTDRNSIAELFYRVSYMCKADTKQYGNGVHGFGTSRI